MIAQARRRAEGILAGVEEEAAAEPKVRCSEHQAEQQGTCSLSNLFVKGFQR